MGFLGFSLIFGRLVGRSVGSGVEWNGGCARSRLDHATCRLDDSEIYIHILTILTIVRSVN